jgi:UDP-N-acetylglucosamine diphosphorylase / glucose-1-phosphate thymidylyltransferase / UDP-N-acetylgalactosamine diphosphorylase / glucosamine-1-phosphate N-acetyltransferase / galactosamine-1-phosphate N-acetyltransferase
MLAPADFFDLSDQFVAALFQGCIYVWEAVGRVDWHVRRLTRERQTITGEVMPGAFVSDRAITIGNGARIEPGAYVLGPAYIGAGCVVRHGAFVRENVIMFPGSVLGHASEAKNSIFLPRAHAPHFNYVGDSILGHRVNLGAGTKLSNLTVVSEKDRETGKRPTIQIQIEDLIYDTGLAKLGAILGDDAQTGCNSVLNPGVLLGQRSLVYANLSLRKGYYGADKIVKLRQSVTMADRK